MSKKLSNAGIAVLIVGGITLILLIVMNTEIRFSPFYIHIHKGEKLMEVFIQICAFLFFDYNGRWKGFREGVHFTLETLEREEERREREAGEPSPIDKAAESIRQLGKAMEQFNASKQEDRP